MNTEAKPCCIYIPLGTIISNHVTMLLQMLDYSGECRVALDYSTALDDGPCLGLAGKHQLCRLSLRDHVAGLYGQTKHVMRREKMPVEMVTLFKGFPVAVQFQFQRYVGVVLQ